MFYEAGLFWLFWQKQACVGTGALSKYCSYDLQHNCRSPPGFILDGYLLRLSFLAPQILSAMASSTNTGFTGVWYKQCSSQTMKHLCSFSSILSLEFYYLGHYLLLPAILPWQIVALFRLKKRYNQWIHLCCSSGYKGLDVISGTHSIRLHCHSWSAAPRLIVLCRPKLWELLDACLFENLT